MHYKKTLSFGTPRLPSTVPSYSLFFLNVSNVCVQRAPLQLLSPLLMQQVSLYWSEEEKGSQVERGVVLPNLQEEAFSLGEGLGEGRLGLRELVLQGQTLKGESCWFGYF